MHFKKYLFIISLFALTVSAAKGEGSWRDKTELLIYSPRYFGPNAFPLPEMRSGKVPTRYEVEVRGEYHYYSGDKTTNGYARALLPFVKGRAGVEVSLRFLEEYEMTPETRDERFAVGTKSPITCHGDVIISSFFQVLTSEKWLDAMVTINLKSASGGRLCDARYTDAAAYWFDVNLGKDLVKATPGGFSLRIQALFGFYCWMTNDLVHRQNDAIAYGGGLTAKYRPVTLSTELVGFDGYKENGDSPMQWRNNLRFEYKKNILSLRYDKGFRDKLYDTLSVGYIRCF
ncbi:hypothetical protein LJC54_04280 [Parabacteroides sp. OttesenSCG-928-J18]|nr:hypothetical protein [Parabacteroides sp. OttesenSCG-928-J18]